MKYVSTRGKASEIESTKAILNGIAADGGLYVPTSVPRIALNEGMLMMNYQQLSLQIMKLFFTDIEEQELKSCIEVAYDKKFEFPEIVPVTDVLGISFLELQHGPTQAFKDMALSILPHLMSVSMHKHAKDSKIVILAATSGDTGKAALEGFADVPDTLVIVFYPKDGVSEIQRKQMVTQQGANTFVVALEGDFDAAQTGVKKLFNDNHLKLLLREQHFELSSANSINIGRLIPQIAYYFYGYVQMCATGNIQLGSYINIAVPTGNFGNILAAYYAKEMGLPINKLICASNENNVLFDFFSTGCYDRKRTLKLTSSPSMDILVSSNLERLLFELSEHNTKLIADLMGKLMENGRYEIPDALMTKLGSFYSNFATENEVAQSIESVFKVTGHLMDTHTAVAHSVYEKYILETGDTTKTMIVSTASPFKFGKSVLKALGQDAVARDEYEINDKLSELSKVPIPLPLKNLKLKPVLHERICKPAEMETILKEILFNSKGEVNGKN